MIGDEDFPTPMLSSLPTCEPKAASNAPAECSSGSDTPNPSPIALSTAAPAWTKAEHLALVAARDRAWNRCTDMEEHLSAAYARGDDADGIALLRAELAVRKSEHEAASAAVSDSLERSWMWIKEGIQP